MSVDLDCNHQVPIPVRFIFQKLISPKKYLKSIYDFWCHSYSLRQDCICREKARLQPQWKKTMQRSSEKAQEECHALYKILGTISTCLGEAEAAEDLPCSQQVKWTVLHRVHLVHSGELLTPAVISPLIHMAWTLLQGLKDVTAFDETIEDLRLKQQQGT